MGVNQKLCKVTVHRVFPQKNTSPETTNTILPRRRTLNTEEPQKNLSSTTTRRRAMTSAHAHTNDSTDNIAILGDKTPNLNPFSRLTLRYRKQFLPKPDFVNVKEDDDCPMITRMDDESPVNSPRAVDAVNAAMASTATTYNDFRLDVDTNEDNLMLRIVQDDVAKVFTTLNTPPLPSCIALEMMEYPRAAPIPSEFMKEIIAEPCSNPASCTSDSSSKSDASGSGSSGDDLTSSFLDVEDDGDLIICSTNCRMSKFNLYGHRVVSQRANRTRTTRGFSFSLRMVQPVAVRRQASVPTDSHHHESTCGTTTITTASAAIIPSTNAALKHGESLHLTFKTSGGQVIQMTGRQGRVTGASMFSKRIRCLSVDDHSSRHDANALRIIGHTTDGIICGGDCISLARTDGQVLRRQKMSRKLYFSSKIDTKAKFIISGVPEGTMVTELTKFYLQSVYDRSKTVGFLKSSRPDTVGCLVMYANRDKDDKSEPVQFFKRVQEQEDEDER